MPIPLFSVGEMGAYSLEWPRRIHSYSAGAFLAGCATWRFNIDPIVMGWNSIRCSQKGCIDATDKDRSQGRRTGVKSKDGDNNGRYLTDSKTFLRKPK